MKQDWWDKPFRTLFTLGESTTAGGWSSCRQRCWANRLIDLINEYQRVPAQLVNVGIGANLISTRSPLYEHSGKPAANERLDAHVLANQTRIGSSSPGTPIEPDLLIISYGLNDARGGTPLDLFCDELRDLVRRVRQCIQPLIVLLGPYYMTDFKGYAPFDKADLKIFVQYNDAIGRVADEANCLFVDILHVYHGADWPVHHDGVHANDLGHQIVANKIFEILATHCSGLAIETRELENSIPPWRDESTLARVEPSQM